MIKTYLYNWNGINQELSQKLHLLIENTKTLEILKLFTEYVGNYKMFPVHFLIILLIMMTRIFTCKDKMSKEHLRAKTTQYFQLLSALIITILCMAATIGAAKEIFSLTRPLCIYDFTLSEYALQYKAFLERTENMHYECELSFPSGHSAYTAAMLTALWKWLSKPFKIAGTITVATVAISRVALGMHFIADVFFAIVMSVFIALAVRHVMEKFFIKRAQRQIKR